MSLFHGGAVQPGPERQMWNGLDSIIAKYNGSQNLVVTGHSLGGALAQVAAARNKLSALVWSSPGVGFSAVRFGLHSQWSFLGAEASGGNGVEVARQKVVVVVPSND